MTARLQTIAFDGLQLRGVEVQVQIAPGLPAFTIVGLPDKAVSEARERVRAALNAIGLALPPKRITVNLAPADLPKEGSHYDLPILLGILVVMEALPADSLDQLLVVGEVSLDGRIAGGNGILPAALYAAEQDLALVCSAANGAEAAWADTAEIVAAPDLLSLLAHLKGERLLPRPRPGPVEEAFGSGGPDLADIRGQESAKRALEIAAAGGHALLMNGPPGSGKSMLAERLATILPPLDAREALDVAMIQSISGNLKDGALSRRRPFRAPHHSASMAALVGGGLKVVPGEVSLAHKGVLFLDELPEFSRGVLDSLRQPLESGQAVVARANRHVTYPAQVQLVAAMNPCRCGHLTDGDLACSRAPHCAADYQAKLSGPLLDRIDLFVDVPPVRPEDMAEARVGEPSADVAARVADVRAMQRDRYQKLGAKRGGRPVTTNAELDGEALDEVAALDDAGQELLTNAARQMKLTARGYVRVKRVARTIADLAGVSRITRDHIAEALAYRRRAPG